MKVKIQIPKKLIPLFLGKADVRAAEGGRGSGKTRTFAKMSASIGYKKAMAGESGIILCGRQFQNSLNDSSFGEVKAAIKDEPFLDDFYECGDKYIRTKDGAIQYVFTGLDRNVSSVKGKSRILLAWIDEAEPVTELAWQTLIPTIREEDSELWVTWNPARKSSPCESRFRYANDPLIRCVELNWRDNPWFPEKLNRERLRDLSMRPDSYDHIWEGGYVTAVTGAYFARHMAAAKQEGRIGRVAQDPLLPVRLFMDIGGTGGKGDAFSIWAVQFIGKEIRVLNYYEAIGQDVASHLSWMHSQGYTSNKASVWLPHDGETHDRVYSVSYESAFTKAGYTVEVIPNQGKGAAMQRIEAVRRWFGSCWFNEATTQGGIDALGWYHEKRDDNRDKGLGPDHDWSSHGADAFGLMAIAAEELFDTAKKTETRVFRQTGWMG